MTDFKVFIDYLKLNKIESDAAKELLKNSNKLTGEEKNLIFAYCYPRQLLDRELPNRVKEFRTARGIPEKGTIYKSGDDLGEITLLLEACKTEQYGRFMKHLMHAFCDPEKIYPVSDSETFNCCICGKSLLGYDDWNVRSRDGELDKNKEYLTFGSKESSVVLCIDCLTHLVAAKELIEEIDPGFLDWTKKVEPKPMSWNDLRLKL